MQKRCEVEVGYNSEKGMEQFAAILRDRIRRSQDTDPGDLSSLIQEMGNNWHIRPISILKEYHFNNVFFRTKTFSLRKALY